MSTDLCALYAAMSSPGDAFAAATEPLAPAAGPLYVFAEPVLVPANVLVVRCDADPGGLRDANPGNWEPDEWDDLLDGALGPWTMAVDDGRVVSLAHTPRAMTSRAAECGVWTAPTHRRRGLASAVAAAWADVLRPSGRALFYATEAGNVASQGVAERLRLRRIGWRWRVGAGQPSPRHPLSPRGA